MSRLMIPAILALAAGCNVAGSDGADQAANLGTGALLKVDYFGDTDVIGFHFELARVACEAGEEVDQEVIEANVDLLNGVFPGMVDLVEEVIDPASRHLAADLFLSIEPGCYAVLAAPASSIDGDDWTPSQDCSAATASHVEVLGGLTSEVTLLSQCVGDPLGALDALVILNQPPVISVGIDEKFNYECEPVNVCVTAYDPNDDPIEISSENLSATDEFSMTPGDATIVGFEAGHRVWEQCAEIVTRFTNSYDWKVAVFDQGIDGDGNLVRMEELVAPELSRAELQFPIHTNWAEELLCFDDGGDLITAPGFDPIVRAEGCEYTSAEDFYCDGTHGVDPAVMEYLCDGTDLIEEALYPTCDAS